MTSIDLTETVSRLRRRVISPTLPRVAAGFKTLYLQCQPANLAKRLSSFRTARSPLAASPGMRPGPREVFELALTTALQCGYYTGRAIGLRSRSRLRTLAIVDASLAEAIVAEPVLRGIAERYPENALHLWAPRAVCELYRAAPYIERIRVIAPARVACRNEVRQLISSLRFGLGMGRHAFKQVFCDAIPVGISSQQLATVLRRTTISPLHVEMQDCSDTPRVYSHDTSAQLAYSRARAWRNEASLIGAATIAAVVPCAQPHDLTIGLGTWASLIREMWMKHKTLPILFPEGNDNAALEQLSSLLNEIPHARLDADVELLERAGLLSRVDLVIAAAGYSAQLSLAQETSTIVIGSESRKSLYSWAGKLLTWLTPDEAGRLDRAEILRACRTLTPKVPRQRVA